MRWSRECARAASTKIYGLVRAAEARPITSRSEEMAGQKGHSYESVGTHPTESTTGQARRFVPKELWSALFSTPSRVTCSMALMVIFAVVNVVALFGAWQMGFVIYLTTHEQASLVIENYTLPTAAISTSLDSQVQGKYYPVCLLMSIGDDTDRPNDKALPFSLLYRLFEGMKTELSTVITAEEALRTELNVFVGVDYTSVACKMARDSLEDAGVEFQGVTLTCHTPEDERKAQVVDSAMKTSCGRALVGGSTRYVTQLTLQWAELIRWSTFRVIDLDQQDTARLPPALPRELWRPTVVTAFSSNHFAVGLLLLRSLGKAALGLYNISVVVYALEDFNATLQGLLDCVIRELNEDYRVPTELRPYDFGAYPSWMRINQSRGYQGTGEYAWKVVMIHAILVERGFILWVDAGCRYNLGGLVESLNYTRDIGFANRRTVGVVPKYVHPGQLKYFRYSAPKDAPRVRNCDGSGVGLTLDKYAELARPWYDCAITHQCIAPDGSSRNNHRQDQAALTLLADMTGNNCEGISSSVKRHMDDHPLNYWGTFPTKCYADPLHV